jgi:lipoprotein signal peptidase
MRLKLFILVFLVDQATKWWAVLCQPDFRFGIRSLNRFGIKLSKSGGYLFGLFDVIRYQRWLIIVLTVCILFVIQLFFRFYWLRFRRNRLTYISFSLIIGGFCGNFLDCLVFEYVRDFILVPLFRETNLADAFLLVGLCLVLIDFCINSNFRKVMFKLRPLRSEIELIAPIFKLPVQDIKKLIYYLTHKSLRGRSGI